MASWYQKNKERAAAWHADWYQKNKADQREKQRVRRQQLEYRIGGPPAKIPIERRRELIRRARGECEHLNESCGGSLCIHHVDGDRENNELSNLLLLCQAHHVEGEHGLSVKGLEARGYPQKVVPEASG